MERKIDKNNVKDILSLSPTQEGILFHYLKDMDSQQYIEQLSLTITGIINVKLIKYAWRVIAEKNEMLRTIFRWKGLEKPMQIVLKEHEIPIDVLDISTEDHLNQVELLNDLKEADRRKGIDLREEPFRITLVKLEEEQLEMIITNHHILYDGWSTGILLKEFFSVYEEITKGIEPIKIEKNQYKEFIKWCNNRDRADQKQYWERYLEDFNTITSFSLNHNSKETDEGKPRKKVYSLPTKLVEEIETFRKNNHITMATLLYTGWGILLGKYSNSKDVVFGTTISGRPPEIYGIEDMVGLFINTLPLRLKAEENETVKDLLNKVDATLRERTIYENTPLIDIQQYSQLPNAQLFDSIVVIENYPMDQMLKQMDGSLKVKGFSMVEQTNYSLTLEVAVFNGIDISIIDQGEFNHELMDSLMKHYVDIITKMVNTPNQKISEIDLLSQEEKQLLLETFNNTKKDYPREKTIHQLFEEQVATTPNNTAILFEGNSLTYSELNEKANQVARKLMEKGVKKDTIVGLMVERSLEMIIGMMGILKAGAAYLPIDPEYPRERVSYMLEDSETKILLLQSWLKDGIEFKGEVLTLEEGELYEGDGSNLEAQNTSEDLAYIIYTSGSTGKPKGVLVEHKTIVNTLSWRIQEYGFTPEDTVLQIPSFAFDSSVEDIFTPLLSGGKLVLLRQEKRLETGYLTQCIQSNNVTHLLISPAFYQTLLKEIYEDLKGLRMVTIAGESFTTELVKEHFAKLEKVKLYNEYGPTENSVCSTIYQFNKEDIKVVIGKPINNCQCYIINENNQLQPIGVVGELAVGGAGLTRGYLKRPELTAEKFVDNPFVAGERMYRTGDLGKWLPDGNIEFVGRIDHQVKIRGFRIELGEIESSLLRQEAVKEAVVIARENPSGGQYLCSYLTIKADFKEVASISDIRSSLGKSLPDYMIPQYMMILEKIPLTTNGKVDRRALPEPQGDKIDTIYTAPRDQTEAGLVEIWQSILNKEVIGINDHFFELGGHSLKATVMVAKIYKTFNIEISIKEIFENPTIKAIAELIKSREEGLYSGIEVAEEKEYYSASPAQRRLHTLYQFDKESLSYNMPGALMLEGSLDIDKLEEVFNELIKRHEALRTSFEIVEGEPVQYIHKEVDLKLQYREAKEEELKDIFKNFIKAFDLGKAPLLRVELVKLSNTPQAKHLLLFDMHHIISDGVSMGILIKEFMEVYGGRNLEPIKLQYKDYSQWQKELLASGKLEKQKKYWLKQLEGEIPVLNLMGDYPRPPIQSFEGEQQNYRLEEKLTNNLKKIAAETGTTMYMVLLSTFNILLSKYSGQEDIIVGSPIAGRSHGDLNNIIGMFVNTLAMRNYPKGEKTFKEFLIEVKKNAFGAYENQDYQFEELVDNLSLRRDISRNPLFDVVFAMQNMELDQLTIDGLSIKPYDFKNTVSKFDLTLLATESENHINIEIEYATKIFKKETIQRLYGHLEKIIEQVTENIDLKLSEVEVIPEEEKSLILEVFNNTKKEYPKDKTIHQLFEEQVEKTPNNVAAVWEGKALSYRQLNERANQLARLLVEKGVKKDTIVAIMVEASLEMMVGIMGILKAGGAYLPIDPEYPTDRIEYMLEDSGTDLFLTQTWLATNQKFNGEILLLDQEEIYVGDGSNLNLTNPSKDLAYVIYTSGSTGRPKGVMVEHSSLINLCIWHRDYYEVTAKDRSTKYAGFAFDASVWEVMPYLLVGASIHIINPEIRLDVKKLNEYFEANEITISFLPTQICEEFMELENKSLRKLLTGGDKLKKYRPRNYDLINNYGPTENTVVATSFRVEEKLDNIPIGTPIANTQIYILDSYDKLQPVGLAGELCIAGESLARGYLNRPELTAEKFVANPFIAGEKMYRTGDLARWLPDGNIEFLGRIDHQVKIRGYRIELGEIENQLINHPAIDEAVVVAKENDTGEKQLWGYIVAKEEIGVSKLREDLGKQLPEYMIPSYILQLEKMPLTPNGKIDTRALPEADGSLLMMVEYEAPRNEIEETLVEIWEEILAVEGIGISHNFFELGGHSLKATTMVGKIHKAFNVEVSLKEIFRNPTIKGISGFIKTAEESIYGEMEVVEGKGYYTASPAQRRLYALQQFDKESTGYNMPVAVMLEGDLDIDRLKKTFAKLIERHEALRTSFGMEEGETVQYIHQNVGFNLQYMEAGDEEALKAIHRDFIRAFDLSQESLLRVGLVKLIDDAPEKHLLIMDLHHIISDGVSMGILVKEFSEIYKGMDLKPNKIQYKDYSEWQKNLIDSGKIEEQKQFWLQQFEGEVPVLNLMGDYPRPAIQSFEGDRLNYQLGAELTSSLRNICKKTGATMYMVLLSAYNVLLSKYSGQEEIIVGSPIAGRPHGDLNNIIGMFVNTLAIRSYPKGEKTFLEFLTEVKKNALSIYENQDYQFEELVENLNLRRDISRNPLFDVVFSMENMNIRELEIEGMSIKPYHLESNISKFDITLSAAENKDRIEISIEYATKIFKKETIERFYRHLENILSQIVDHPEVQLSDIQLITELEKNHLKLEFNNTQTPYPKFNTLHQVFETQVEKNPNATAVIFEDNSLTYRGLNQRANQLARGLRKRGVKSDTIVAIMMERSLELVVGVMAILKAGGAYLPIDPKFPNDRKKYMLEDSGADLLLTQSFLMKSINRKEINFEGEILPLDDEGLYVGEDTNLTNINQTQDLAYVLFTSGSTGRPKGVMIQHDTSLNTLFNLQRQFPILEGDSYLLKTNYCFDVSVIELFAWFAEEAGKLVVLKPSEEREPQKMINIIKKEKITHINFVPSMMQVFMESITEENIEDLKSLKYVILGGEAVTKDLASRFYRKTKGMDVSLENIYGPTENSIYCSRYAIPREEKHGSVPIGTPVPNVQIYILNSNNQQQPIGVPGELCIGGSGLGRGYLNKPELTAEKFIKHPFIEGERMYKTGDLARWFEDGNIEYLGRIDHQVKIRGYRIELGEIENALLKQETITEALVMVREDQGGNKYLCGYIVAGIEINIGDLKQALLKEIPEYMVPQFIVQLGKMPLNPNGKVDRKALPEPEGNILMDTEYEAPSNEVEETLVAIWEEILGIDGIGTSHNFFDMGGHSLKATIMVTKIHKILNVEVPLKEIFQNPTIKGIAEIIKVAAESTYGGIKVVEKKEYYPTSPAQRRLFTLQQMEPEGKGYNMPGAMMLEGNVDLDKIQETFERLVARHDALRTSFKMMDLQPVQYLHSAVDFKIQYMETKAEELEDLIEDFVKPFDLTKAPLLRVGLVKVLNDNNEKNEIDEKTDKYLLIFDMHHIISDGVSMGILVKEFAALHQGRILEPLRLQYKDYSQWQADLMKTGKIEEQKQYWMQQFEGEIPVLNLMGDYSRPAIQSFEGDRLAYKLEDGLTSGLRKISKETGTTMYMVLLSAFNVLLSKYSQQEDIVIGSPIAGRPHADLSNIMGMFVNTLAMRNFPEGEKTFKAFLLEVKKNALGAYENQDYQFEELVDNLNIRRDLSRNPLFDVMFTMQNIEMGQLSMDGMLIKPYDLKNNISKFDITLSAMEKEENIDIGIEYATKIFKKETMERLYRHLENILRQITENPEMKLSDLELITTEEKHQLLEEFNDTKVEYIKDKTIQEIFEEQVEKTPDNVAVVFKNESLTYEELNEKSNQVARLLRDHGVQTDDLVGIMMERSLEMIVGLMAILKAGGAYLPIDPQYPVDRIKYMMEDSDSKILLTQGALNLHETFNQYKILLDDKETYAGDSSNLENINHPQDLAYVIYTSGSTGNPKGLMVEHSNVINLCHWFNREYNITENRNIMQTTNLSFDVSVEQILGGLLNGGKVCIPTGEEILEKHQLRRFMIRNEIQIAQFVPATLKEHLGEGERIECLKVVTCGGDQLQEPLMKEIIKKGYPLYNHYGPTETTVDALTSKCEAEKPVVIGKPIDNAKIYIISKENKLQPIGVVGELCISGDGVTRGYLNNPQLTADKFIDNPFVAGEKMYRTGDLARWLSDGNIQFLGRIDHQVKIRGYRIELGEIENQLLEMEAIREAILVVKEDHEAAKYLAAYIVAEKNLTVSEIRAAIGEKLPEYMIPSYIMQLDKMPLTPNGKVDRRALPEPDGTISTGVEYEAPRNKMEESLVEIWQEVLGIKEIGIHDNFFELGGHSLRATSMVAKMNKMLNVEVPMREIFKKGTIKEISDYIQNTAKKVEYLDIEALQEQTHYPVSSAQRRIYLQWQLSEDSTAYNMPSALMLEGELQSSRLEDAINQLVKRHEAFRTSFVEIQQEIMQKIHKEMAITIDYHELRDKELQEMTQDFIQPFDLSKAPLLRVALIKIAHQKHLLLFDMHHIISDGVSMAIVKRDFMKLYEGENLPPLRVQYKDYASWHNDLLTSEVMEDMKKYWMDKLKDFTDTHLPTKGNSATETTGSKTLQVLLDAEMTEGINDFCIKHQMTKSVFILGIFKFLIMKTINQKDITVGIPVAGRRHAELENIIGVFLNVLLVRSHVGDEGKFIDYLHHFRDNYMESQEYQDYPYEQLFENAMDTLKLKGRSLFSILFNYMPMQDDGELKIDELAIKSYQLQEPEAKYSLTLYGREGLNDIGLEAVYNNEVDEYAVEGILSSIPTVIERVLGNEDLLIEDLMRSQDSMEFEEEFDMAFDDNEDFF